MRRLNAVLLTFALLAAPPALMSQTTAMAYHSYAELTSALEELQSQYSDLVHIRSIGTTREGREIWLAAIRKGDPEQSRAMLIVGGVEPTQVSGSELALGAIGYFAAAYGKADSITRLLNTTTIYIIPRVSPDASESFFADVKQERSINANPYDGDRDGESDEDDVEDLNGDGLITLMRVEDPLGEWLPSPDDGRILKKASPATDERGSYRVYSEGTDNDKDEKWNEDPAGGVNFNRNFTFRYEFFGASSGVYQVSEPESRAVADFIFSHPSISVVFSYSPNDNLMTAWKARPRSGGERTRVVSSIQKEDEDVFEHIAKRFKSVTHFADGPKPEKGAGTFSEWAYYHAGRWSFSSYPWWATDIKAKADTTEGKARKEKAGGSKGSSHKPSGEKDEAVEQQLRTLKWYEAAGVADVFVPWKEFKHPDFPDRKVEIGGMKPFALFNPPAESLAATSASFNAFFTDLAMRLPRLSLENTKVDRLRAGVYRLTADVVNDGYFPTNAALGHRIRWVREVVVTLGLSKGQSLSGGVTRQVLDPIPGNGGKTGLSWIILSPEGSPVSITAESPASGTATVRKNLR